MYAFKTQFDGERIIIPKELHLPSPAEVIVIVPDSPNGANEKAAWMKNQEKSFSEVWQNEEDAVYDSL